MANDIENYIVIENSNEEVQKEVQRIFQTEEGQWEVHSEDLAKRVFGEDILDIFKARIWIDFFVN